MYMKDVFEPHTSLEEEKGSKVCTCCTRHLSLDRFYKKRGKADTRCGECVKGKKATKRKMTKLSMKAKEKNVIRLIELNESKVYMTTCESHEPALINLADLVRRLVEEVIFNDEERNIA